MDIVELSSLHNFLLLHSVAFSRVSGKSLWVQKTLQRVQNNFSVKVNLKIRFPDSPLKFPELNYNNFMNWNKEEERIYEYEVIIWYYLLWKFHRIPEFPKFCWGWEWLLVWRLVFSVMCLGHRNGHQGLWGSTWQQEIQEVTGDTPAVW